MRFIYFAFALALLSFSASAQDKDGATPQSSTSVVVNGQSIKGKVREMDGKHFVAVEDLAQSMHGTIAYGDGQISLTLPQLSSMAAKPAPPQPPPAAAHPSSPQQPPVPQQEPSTPVPTAIIQPLGTGQVKGTLTYFFDFHTGNKPDTGSKVWLVTGQVEIPADKNFVASSTALGTGENPQQYSVLKYSAVDENGTFEWRDVAPGQYTLILQSAHTKWTLKEKRDFFGRGNGHNPRDSNGRVAVLSLLVKAGETADASKDFGPNIDK